MQASGAAGTSIPATAGNPGARLLVTDECTLGIVTVDNRSIFSTLVPCRVFMTQYLLNPGLPLRDPEHGEIQHTRSAPGSGKLQILRDPSAPWRWVRYGFNTDRIWVERDTTGHPAGQALGEAYDTQPSGSMWLPQIWSAVSWAENRRVIFTTTLQYFNLTREPACTYGETLPCLVGEHRFRHLGYLNLGGHLGVVDVAIVERHTRKTCYVCTD